MIGRQEVIALCVGLAIMATCIASSPAGASQEDDLHRIAVAVEKIAQHAERCK